MATGALSLPPTSGTSTQNQQPSWEGDKMFNIYIYDYCNKRGFRETAQKLMVEAEIPPDSAPPINAKQGLLFEWWSVFWVLFTAKSSGAGSDDALLYVQQQSQTAQRQAQARMQPQQPPIGRYINGIQRQPGAMPPNGQIPNGVGPASLQGAQGPIPNGAPGPMSFPMQGPGPQQNGIPGTPGGPPAPGSTPQQQQPGFQPMLPGQRPGGPQQRGPNNGPPFQSPTMAPQIPGGVPGQQQPPAMGQLGPSPHLAHMPRGGNMLPPNGQQQATNPAFQQLQRPPSRTASPSNMLAQVSPSMASRQTPGGMPNTAQEASLHNELSKIPTPVLMALRQETGLGDRDLNTLSVDEKQRLISIARQRVGSKAGLPGGSNAAAGPSMQPNQRPQRQGTLQQRGGKRNSTSPADEHDTLPRNDQSPPDRKRPRRSPLSSEQGPPMGSANYPPQGQQPGGGQGGPQQLQNGMMRPMNAPGLNGFPQAGVQMGNNSGMNMQMGGQPMGGPQMSPQAMPMQQQQQQMARFHQEQQYRQSMQNLQKGALSVLNNTMSVNAGSPSSGDSQGQGSQFAGGRPGQNNMNQKGMMPPPSPASGPPKDQSGQNKDKGGQSSSNNRPEGSPRNPPRTPAQGGANLGNSGQGGTAPPTPNMTAPSPSAILGGPTSAMNQPMASSTDPMAAIFGNTDFINGMSTLDGFVDDASLVKAGFDVDFERDFGQWFNPETDVTGSIDPK